MTADAHTAGEFFADAEKALNTLISDNKRLREALEGLVRSIGEKWDGETERRRANALSPNIEEALESARRALEVRG